MANPFLDQMKEELKAQEVPLNTQRPPEFPNLQDVRPAKEGILKRLNPFRPSKPLPAYKLDSRLKEILRDILVVQFSAVSILVAYGALVHFYTRSIQDVPAHDRVLVVTLAVVLLFTSLFTFAACWDLRGKIKKLEPTNV